MSEEIGVWHRIENMLYVLEAVDGAPPFHIRNRFTIHVQSQPYGANPAECDQILDDILLMLNNKTHSDNQETI